ncbi:MAG: HAD family acid phosphatase [Legionellales bacterium]
MKPYSPLIRGFLRCLSLILVLSHQAMAEPSNLGLLKQKIHSYHNSGRYQKELQQVVNQAENYIVRQAVANQHKKSQQKLALVLDIDETSLSNYRNIVDHDFAGDPKSIYKHMLAADDPAIGPTLALYNSALHHGIKIFFITGRPLSLRDATVLNLKNAGFKNWSGIYMRPEHYHSKSIIPFKSQSRAAITQKGYTIIASIGDQYSDIKGGYAQKGFKLPNPFYYLP